MLLHNHSRQWISHELTPMSFIRRTTYMEIANLLGTSGCSKNPPYWTAQALGVWETERGKTVVCPGDWLVNTKAGKVVMSELDFEEEYFNVKQRPADVNLIPPEFRNVCNFLDPNIYHIEHAYHHGERPVIVMRSIRSALIVEHTAKAYRPVYRPDHSENDVWKKFDDFCKDKNGLLILTPEAMLRLTQFDDPRTFNEWCTMYITFNSESAYEMQAMRCLFPKIIRCYRNTVNIQSQQRKENP